MIIKGNLILMLLKLLLPGGSGGGGVCLVLLVIRSEEKEGKEKVEIRKTTFSCFTIKKKLTLKDDGVDGDDSDYCRCYFDGC